MREYQTPEPPNPINMDDGTTVTPTGDGGYSWTNPDGTTDSSGTPPK